MSTLEGAVDPLQEPACHLLDLPPEIFIIIVRHILNTSPRPEYNRFRCKEYCHALQPIHPEDVTSFINLASTCSAARGLCYASAQVETVRADVGWRENEYGGGPVETAKQDVEGLRRRVGPQAFKATTGFDVAAREVDIPTGYGGYEDVMKILASNKQFRNIRYLGPVQSSTFVAALPDELDYLEVFAPGPDWMGYRGQADLRQIRVNTLVIVDATSNEALGLTSQELATWRSSMACCNDWDEEGWTAFDHMIRCFARVKHLIVRLDPQNGDWDFHGQGFLSCIGRHMDSGDLADLDSLTVDMLKEENCSVGEGPTRLLLVSDCIWDVPRHYWAADTYDEEQDHVRDFLNWPARLEHLPSLRNININIHLDECELWESMPEVIFGSPAGVQMATEGGYARHHTLAALKRNNIPPFRIVEQELRESARLLPEIRHVNLEIRWAPDSKFPERRLHSPPILELHAELNGEERPVTITKKVLSDEWERCRETEIWNVFRRYMKQHAKEEDYERVNSGASEGKNSLQWSWA